MSVVNLGELTKRSGEEGLGKRNRVCILMEEKLMQMVQSMVMALWQPAARMGKEHKRGPNWMSMKTWRNVCTAGQDNSQHVCILWCTMMSWGRGEMKQGVAEERSMKGVGK